MIKYCDITNWCDESESSYSSEFSENVDCFTDTLTNTICKELIIIDCEGITPPLLRECGDICRNDETYYTLFLTGQILNLQYRFFNEIDTGATVNYGWDIGTPTNYFIQAWLVNCCDETQETEIGDVVDGTNYYVGKINESLFGGGTIYNDVQAIRIDTDEINYDCFYLRIRVHHDLTGTNYTEYYTQPYKRIDCRHDYVLMSSTIKTKDEVGNYYVEPDSIAGVWFEHNNEYYVRGEMVLQRIGFEKVFMNEYKSETKSRQVEYYLLRTFALNEDAAKIIASIINGYDLYIDGTLLVVNGEIDKNFDDGESWFPEIEFKSFGEFNDNLC